MAERSKGNRIVHGWSEGQIIKCVAGDIEIMPTALGFSIEQIKRCLTPLCCDSKFHPIIGAWTRSWRASRCILAFDCRTTTAERFRFGSLAELDTEVWEPHPKIVTPGTTDAELANRFAFG
jgi:hypothetical protein